MAGFFVVKGGEISMNHEQVAIGLANQYGGILEGANEILAPVFDGLPLEDLNALREQFQQRMDQDPRFVVLFEHVSGIMQ